MASDSHMWVKFFESTGLPPKIATKYGMLFLEHRIQRNMLPDLTKSILNEIGISAIGDVLAILKQAKVVVNKDEVEAKETQAVRNRESKNPANGRGAVAATKTKLAVPSKPTRVSPMKRARVEPEADRDGDFVVKMPAGTTERSREILKKAAAYKRKTPTPPSQTKSVFDRLGKMVKNNETMDDEQEDYNDDPGPFPRSLSLRKTVSFSPDIKESSPEVTSTTEEYFGRLQSDKLARKVSALQRLGTKSLNETIKVDAGGRRMLVAKRITPTSRAKGSIFDRLGYH